MENRHILIVEKQPVFSEMMCLWLQQAPQVCRVSCLENWESGCELESTVNGIFLRAENLPSDHKILPVFLKRNRMETMTILGEGPALEVPGCVVTYLHGAVCREDVLHALGLTVNRSRDLEGRDLTEKETAVVIMTVNGSSMKEIAEALECTLSTIQTYKTRAMVKMGVDHLADLSVTAAAKGLRTCPCSKNKYI